METPIEIIRKIAGEKNADSFVATVETVNGRTCDVQPVDGAPLKRVRLNTNISDAVGLVITPVEGTPVLVTRLSEVDSFVSLFSEIEKVELVIGETTLLVQEDKAEMVMGTTNILIKDGEMETNIGGAQVKVSGDKFTIKNGDYALKQALNELATIIKGITVPTPAGPSGTPLPPTIQAVTKFEQDISKLFE